LARTSKRKEGAPAKRRKATLRESAEQFRLAQEALGIVTWIWDVATDRVQWYGDMSRLLGLRSGAFHGDFQDYLRYVHPEDAPRARTTFVDCLKGRRQEYRAVERVVWADGSVHWLETFGRASYGPDGRAVRMMGAIKEVTERKRQESARARAEKQLSRVFDASPDYIVVVRAEDGQFITANPAFEKATGYRADEIVGRTVGELNIWALPGERERFIGDLQATGSLQDRPVMLRTRSGAVLSGRMSATLVEHEGERLIISLMQDVSAVKQLERRARQSESKYAAMFATNPEAIVITRLADGKIMDVNAAWERYSGYRRDHALGRSAVELHSWEEPGHREAAVRRLMTEGSFSNFETRLRRADGTFIEALLSAGRIEIDGEQCAIWSWRDVTGLRAAERRALETDRKFSALFETSPAGLIVTRPRDRRVVEINSAALKLVGLQREQVLGGNPVELVDIINREEVEEARARALDGQTGVTVPVRFMRRDGTAVEAQMSAALIQLGGEPHFVLSLLDVTEQRRVERERHEAERKFAALFEDSPEPISLLRLRDEVRLAANSAWERVAGYSRNEASARPATAMSLFKDPAERASLIARVAGEGRVSNYEIRLVRADGSEFDALISGSRIEVDGEPCILWNWSDVSQQKQAQRALRESEERFRALTELSADWYWEQDENFRFVWQRSQPTHPEDQRPPNQIGLTRWEAHADSLSVQEWAAHRAVVEAHESFRNLEFPSRAADGSMRWVSVSGHPFFDDQGAFRGYRGVGRDITERKRNENLLMNIARGVSSELGDAFFRSLVEHLARELGADFAFIAELSADRARTRTLALLAYGTIVPNTDYEMKGSLAELALHGTVVHSSGMRELMPDHERIRQHGIEAFVGTPLYGADGTVLGVLAVAHRKPIERGAFWASMIEIFGARAAAEIQRSRAEAQVRAMNDALESLVHERTAQLEDANRELESYNFSISHDLRQPLSAISGFADLLRDLVADASDAALKDCVAEIESNALRMEQMIDSLLRLSRAGRAALRREPVEAKSMVESVLHDLSVASPLDAELVLGELPAAQADPVLLRQVWANLIGNALKYSRTSRAPRVEISGVRRNGAVEYAVRDNGVGFDMKHAERLFGAFQRLPTSKGFEGNGVGLAIVERIVRRHGGTIRAESMPGKGATFRFTLPH
jgi:PAS domain S-box-containing protein